jgi:hypothetical protein
MHGYGSFKIDWQYFIHTKLKGIRKALIPTGFDTTLVTVRDETTLNQICSGSHFIW